MHFVITAIRYQLPKTLTAEERDAQTMDLLQSLPLGSPLILQAEPDNPVDPHAVGVYLPDSIKRLGYVGVDYLDDIRPRLDSWGNASATIHSWDGHVTLIGLIQGAPATAAPHERQLPPAPFPRQMNIPILPQERIINRLCPRLLSLTQEEPAVQDQPQGDNDPKAADLIAQQVMDIAEQCLEGLALSVCGDDVQWRRLLCESLKGVAEKSQGEKHDRAQELYTQAHQLVRNIRRNSRNANWEEWLRMLDTTQLFAGKSPSKTELEDWLKQADIDPCSPQLSDQLYYRHLSRAELYDAAAVLLLWNRHTHAYPRWEHENRHLVFEEAIPEFLRSGKLFRAWNQLRDAGILDAEYQLVYPNKSDASLLVLGFCKYQDKNRWSIFEKFWNLENLKTHKGTPSKKTRRIIEEIFRNC